MTKITTAEIKERISERKKKKALICLDEINLEKIDRIAEAINSNRSAAINALIESVEETDKDAG